MATEEFRNMITECFQWELKGVEDKIVFYSNMDLFFYNRGYSLIDIYMDIVSNNFTISAIASKAVVDKLVKNVYSINRQEREAKQTAELCRRLMEGISLEEERILGQELLFGYFNEGNNPIGFFRFPRITEFCGMLVTNPGGKIIVQTPGYILAKGKFSSFPFYQALRQDDFSGMDELVKEFVGYAIQVEEHFYELHSLASNRMQNFYKNRFPH